MKRASALMVLIAVLILISSLFMAPAAADKNKKSARDLTKKPARPSAANFARPASGAAFDKKSEDHDRNLEGRNSDGQEALQEDDEQDPDLPPGAKGIDKQDFIRLRDEYNARLRGVEPGMPYDPLARGRALRQLEHQESRMRFDSLKSLTPNAALASWVPLGPRPLPNGQSLSGGGIAVSGRVTALVVDPTNPNKIYLGAAQGGVWRSLDGGATWLSIFDSAQSLAIGALAIAPSSPSTLYVGTGEYNACGDCFFGAGLYRIDNADTVATLVGPINPAITVSNLTYNVFNGRSISKILIHPSDPATIFVTTGTGVGGSGGNSFGLVPNIATRGLYRSTNATSSAAAVTFQKLVVSTDNSPDSPATGNVSLPDMVMEPGDPNILIVSAIGIAANGGIYRTVNALAATPTFTQTLALAAGIRTGLTIDKVGSVVTLYAATGETPSAPATCTTPDGALRKSIDGGVTWSPQLTGGGGFCGGQCFYNITVAVDPNDANIVYLGGNARGSCSDGMKKSVDGGTTFTRDDTGLHADAHALFFDTNTNPSTIYTGNDGGVWKRASNAAAGSAWTNLNNAPLDTLQFESIAVHPTDRNITIGGTQDNGTELQQTVSGTWTNSRGGDGGYVLIDQSATDTTNVNMYHTFFNSSGSQIRFERVTTLAAAASGAWTNIGCTGGVSNNGITCNDNVLFYAPMATGPGTPNTVYFGSDRLYRSLDRGTNNQVVSQAPISGTSPVSTIGISPQDDNYRVVGMQNGQVWATSTGSSTLVNITSGGFPTNPNGSVTNKFVGRAIVDPNNKDVAYITFSFFAPAGQGVWKISNLGAAAGNPPAVPVWTAVGNGIPSVPINAFAVDPQNSNHLYAGTDIGVYFSADGGASWNPYGTGLPRSAVFGLVIQSPNRLVRISTHGRGMWEISTAQANTNVQFSAANYNVGEGAASVTITVTRSGNTSGAATVDFLTSDGTALQNQDYQVASGTLSFAATETSKTFNVSIIEDVLVEGNETLNLTLSNPVGSSLAAPSTATITITDNDTPMSKKTGVFRPSTGELFLKNANSSGFADTLIIFGNPGDYPLAGDWNGDGIDSVGIYRDGVFYLRNTNSTGFADIVVPFGSPGDQPIAGDWNGDGMDTIGIYRNGTFYLRNSNTAGAPDLVFTLGNPGDVGIAGDWNGDGITTCGVFRPSNGIVYLKNSNTTGFADLFFVYGNAGDKPVAGDWNGDGIDSVGIYRNGLFFLTNSNTTGFADIVFALGNSGDFPIAGNWNGSP
jgi:hypothetical protein